MTAHTVLHEDQEMPAHLCPNEDCGAELRRRSFTIGRLRIGEDYCPDCDYVRNA